MASLSPRFVWLVAAAAILAAGHGAWAGPPSDELRGHVDQVLKILEDPELQKDGRVQERRAAIRKVANDIFDFQEITRRSLGRHWQGRTPAEQTEFVGLLTDLLERTYISRIERYAGEKVAFVGDSVESGLATVRTKLVTKEGTEIPIDYRMYRQGSRWRAYDVTVEGVSLTANYRTQFNAIIRKASYGELVRRLKEKQEEGQEAAPVRRPASPPEARAAPPADGTTRRQSP